MKYLKLVIPTLLLMVLIACVNVNAMDAAVPIYNNENNLDVGYTSTVDPWPEHQLLINETRIIAKLSSILYIYPLSCVCLDYAIPQYRISPDGEWMNMTEEIGYTDCEILDRDTGAVIKRCLLINEPKHNFGYIYPGNYTLTLTYNCLDPCYQSCSTEIDFTVFPAFYPWPCPPDPWPN